MVLLPINRAHSLCHSAGMEGIHRTEVVLGCSSLEECLAFFRRLGFVVDAIFPADNPSVAVISACGLSLRLDSAVAPAPMTLNLYCSDVALTSLGRSPLVAPNGACIRLLPTRPALSVPSLVEAQHVTHMDGDQPWVTGRAGMLYRDLIPSRLGGRFVASHIRIPDGGSVPDYVHFHRIRLQVIFCVKGWVKVVYEDQGEPFLLRAGDCVLQPPEIRHRVLECSPGLEVVEIGCPAEHETIADHDMPLPSGAGQPGRRFGGQLFSHHVAAEAEWQHSPRLAFAVQTSGIFDATDGLASLTVWKHTGAAGDDQQELTHQGEFRISFVLNGFASLKVGEKCEKLAEGSAFCLPAGCRHYLTQPSDDFSWLEIEVPSKQGK